MKTDVLGACDWRKESTATVLLRLDWSVRLGFITAALHYTSRQSSEGGEWVRIVTAGLINILTHMQALNTHGKCKQFKDMDFFIVSMTPEMTSAS